MTAGPLASVIIPAFGAADTVEAAVRSALSQPCRPSEVSVDDSSTDATAGVVSLFGPDARLARQANRGPGPARNEGANKVTGGWLAPRSLSDQLKSLATEGIACIEDIASRADIPVAVLKGRIATSYLRDASAKLL